MLVAVFPHPRPTHSPTFAQIHSTGHGEHVENHNVNSAVLLSDHQRVAVVSARDPRTARDQQRLSALGDRLGALQSVHIGHAGSFDASECVLAGKGWFAAEGGRADGAYARRTHACSSDGVLLNPCIASVAQIIDRAQEKLMSKKKAPNIITAGYRSVSWAVSSVLPSHQC